MTTVNTNNTANSGNSTQFSTSNIDQASSESVDSARENINKLKAKMAGTREKLADKKEDFIAGLNSIFAKRADKINDIFIKITEKRIERLEKNNDDGSKTERIVKQQEKLAKLQGAGVFWKTQKAFWEKEHKLNYPPENHEKVQEYYDQIGDLQRKFSNIVMGFSKDDPQTVTSKIAELQGKIAELNGVPEN